MEKCTNYETPHLIFSNVLLLSPSLFHIHIFPSKICLEYTETIFNYEL